MGFKASVRVLNLLFENPELEGLEVRARSLSMGRVLEVAKLRDMVKGEGGEEGALIELFKVFEQALVSWNLEGDDGPVAMTVDGLLSLDMSLALMIVMTWFDSITAVGEALGKGSTSGSPTLEASMPMEIG